MEHLQFSIYPDLEPTWKIVFFVSFEEFYLTLILFLRSRKFQFVINKALIFTIHSMMSHKKVGNQILGLQSDDHVMKTQSTAVDPSFNK